MRNVITVLFLFLSFVTFWSYVSAAGKENFLKPLSTFKLDDSDKILIFFYDKDV